MSRTITFVLIAVLVASGVLAAESVSAQTLKPVVSEFWLQYVDNSYDVAPSATSTKDLYTGEVTNSTVPGYRVENKSIVVTIKNPPDVDAYNFRWKDHNGDVWHYEPFNPDNPLPLHAYDCIGIRSNASNSDYTVLSLIFIPKTYTSVDVQVQALYGDYRAVPYGGALGLPTYDFYFDGQASYWSHTETIDFANAETPVEPTAVPTPTVTETPVEHPTAAPTHASAESGFVFNPDWKDVALAAAFAVIAVLAAALLLRRRGAKKNA